MYKAALLACLLAAAPAANAEVVAKIEGNGAQILLTDEGPSDFCKNVETPQYPGVKNAVFLDPRGGRVNGCWLAVNGEVHLIFEDGDIGSLPIKSFQWKPGMKPVRVLM